MLRRAVVVAAVLSAASVASCSKDSVGPLIDSPCESFGLAATLKVSVSKGTTPSFDWSPRCKIGYIDVHRASDGTMMWQVTNGSFNPSVKYGVAPPHTLSIAAAPLVKGTEYEVYLESVLGPRIGVARFTP
jgi:hypothetical protein